MKSSLLYVLSLYSSLFVDITPLVTDVTVVVQSTLPSS